MNDRLRPDYAQMSNSSSAPRLNFSSQDIFNLRNHNLSEISRSTPGIYSPIRRDGEKLDLFGKTPSKGILVSKNDITTSRISGMTDTKEITSMEIESQEKQTFTKIRQEIQFTLFVIVCFVFLIVVPISMIIVGLVHMYSCSAQPMIPIYLVVAGSSFLSFIFLFRKLHGLLKQKEYKNESCYSKCLIFSVLLQIGWFIAGSYWIYGAYAPEFIDTSSSIYCHKTLYQYAFWFLNSVFLSSALFIISFLVYVVFGRPKNHEMEVKV